MKAGKLCTRDVVVAEAQLPLQEAAERMCDARVSDLPVVEPVGGGARLIGILTARDVVVAATAQEPGWLRSLTVADVMTSDIAVVREDDEVGSLVEWLGEHGIRRVPVADDHGNLVGVVAVEDVHHWLASELASATRALTTRTLDAARPMADLVSLDGLPAHTD